MEKLKMDSEELSRRIRRMVKPLKDSYGDLTNDQRSTLQQLVEAAENDESEESCHRAIEFLEASTAGTSGGSKRKLDDAANAARAELSELIRAPGTDSSPDNGRNLTTGY